MAASDDDKELEELSGDSEAPLRTRAIRGVGWTAFHVIGGRVISLVVFVVLARLLDIDEIGLVAFALILVDFLHFFATQGFFDAVIQLRTITKDHLNAALWANAVIGSLFTILGILAAPTIAAVFNIPDLEPIFQWLCPLFVIVALTGVYRASLQRQLSFDLPAVLLIIGEIAGGVAGISVALSDGGVWSLVAQQLTAKGTGLVLFAVSSKWQPGWHFSWDALLELYAFGLKMIANKVLAFSNRQLPQALIVPFLGEFAFGLFSVGNRVLQTFSQVAFGIVRPVAFAAIARMQEDLKRVRSAYYQGTQLLSLMALPIFVGFALVADTAIPFFFGAKWQGAVILVRIMTIPVLLQSLVLTLSTVTLQATGRPGRALLFDGCYGAVQVLGFFVVIALGGTVQEVTMMFAVTACLASVAILWILWGVLDLSLGEYSRQFASPVAATVFMSVCVVAVTSFLPPNMLAVPEMAIQVFVGAIAFVLAVIAIDRPLCNRVLDILRTLIRRRSPAKSTQV